MKRIARTSLLSAFMLALAVTHAAWATPPKPVSLCEYKLDAFDMPALYGRATLRFSVTRTYYCRGGTELTLEVKTSESLRCLGQRTWSFPHEPAAHHSVEIEIDIPPDDTSFVEIWMVCGELHDHAVKYFVTTGEKLEVWSGSPRHYAGRKKPTPPDTTKYEIRIDLREPARYAFIKQYEEQLGPLVETPDSGFYRIRVTRESIRELRMEGFGVDVLEEVPGLQVPPPKQDSSHAPGKKGDSADIQGSFRRSPLSNPGIHVWLDSVGGMMSNGKLPSDQTITFFIGYENNSNCTVKGVTNGFRVYSLDGAYWTTTAIDTTGAITMYMFLPPHQKFNYFSVTGYGSDTVGYGAYASPPAAGIPDGFSDVVATIEIGPIPTGYEGTTICLDSSFYPPSGVWKWAPVCTGFYPSWDGPHCFEVASWDSLQFTGHLYYLDPVPPDTTPEPMRDVTIEMWDDDSWPDSDDLLATCATTNSGYFDLGPVSNDDIWAGHDVFFRIYAQNDAAYVTVAHNGDRHRIQTSVSDDLPGGIYDTTITASLDDSGPFFVADAVLNGYRKWDSLRAEDIPQVEVVVAADTGSTHYSITDDYILINDSINETNWWPDTWDRDVILHEYGHKIAFTLEFCDNMTGYPAVHYFHGIYNPETAAIEGWAHLWSAVVRNDVFQSNWRDDFADVFWINVENGEYGLDDPTSSQTYGSVNALGLSNEGAVAGMLWDIYDSHNDDYSSSSDWGLTRIPHSTDGIGDDLHDGIDSILIALLDRSVNGHHPDNLHEFWDAWFDYTYPSFPMGDGYEMVDIWHEHGVSVDSGCCIGLRGNVDGQSGELVDIADLVYLVDYMFLQGPVPPCMPEADVNVSGLPIDIGDLVWLVDYMYTGGWTPSPCPY